MSEHQGATLEELLASLRAFNASTRDVETGATKPPDTSHAADNAKGAKTMLEALNKFAGFRSTPSLERKLAQVLRNTSSEEIRKLVERASSNDLHDIMAIVEDLTNHETFFFRDMMQFLPFRDVFMPEFISYQRTRGKKIRIWSSACSTGEEVYTLAILALHAMQKAGIASWSSASGYQLHDGWSLEVIGTDISRQAIRRARDAVYEESTFGAFRQTPEGWQREFVEASTGIGRHGQRSRFLSPLPSIRRYVRFDTFNLMSANPPLLDCDLVVCRNVLIYLDSSRHGDIQTMLARALRPGGVLIPSLVDQINCRTLRARWIDRCAFYDKL